MTTYLRHWFYFFLVGLYSTFDSTFDDGYNLSVLLEKL